ncbi:MAG: hypothetical protein RLZZ516_2124, partial [Cyanobacteriota bacterium]
YADLSQNRITNYQFSFDRMLALQGNTAPYLLYAVVRIAGIARKGGELGAAASATPSADGLQFSEPQEWALVRELLKFDAVIAEVEEELLPNRLCTYLFELSQVFNRFYDQVPCSRPRTRRAPHAWPSVASPPIRSSSAWGCWASPPWSGCEGASPLACGGTLPHDGCDRLTARA